MCSLQGSKHIIFQNFTEYSNGTSHILSPGTFLVLGQNLQATFSEQISGSKNQILAGSFKEKSKLQAELQHCTFLKCIDDCF